MSNDVNVFLTNSNYNKLKSMYAGLVLKVDEEVRNRVYKENLSWILADFDYKYLFAEVLLLNNSGLVITKKNKKTRNDIFIFDEKDTAKYHYSRSCEYSTKDYLNFEIPEEVKTKGLKEIERFKKFSEEHKSILYSDEALFLKKIEAAFFLKNVPKRINYPNSGVSKFSGLSLAEMENAIDSHIEEARVFYDNNPSVKNYNYAHSGFLGRVELSKDDEKWHNFFKRDLKLKLKEYIQKRDADEFALKKDFLDSLGFEGCKACAIELDF